MARLLLLASSRGFVDGVERVADAVQNAWEGDTERLDLYDRRRHDRPSGNPRAKVALTLNATASAVRRRPDVVACLHIGLLPAALAAARLARAPVALFVYGDDGWSPLGPAARAAVRRCAAIVAISDFTARWFARRAGLDPRRIRVIPPAVDAALLAARPAGNGNGAAPVVLTVAQIRRDQRYKGHAAVAAAFPSVLRRVPDARWVVIGGGDDVPALRECCSRAGIAEAVELRGTVPDADLAAAYASARVFVLPSRSNPEARPPYGEGFGLVFAEAGLFGVPSITSDQGGGSLEYVEDGVTGRAVAADDPTALADAIVALLCDPGEREQLGRAARERTLERHMPEAFAAALGTALPRRGAP
jgi:glycosyltransferase involved in cell wall biosynthesis